MNNMTSENLLRLFAGSNDQRAFRELYDRHSAPVLSYLSSEMDINDARDVLQEVFICVWRLHHTYERGAGVGGWILAIARSRVATHRNRETAS